MIITVDRDRLHRLVLELQAGLTNGGSAEYAQGGIDVLARLLEADGAEVADAPEEVEDIRTIEDHPEGFTIPAPAQPAAACAASAVDDIAIMNWTPEREALLRKLWPQGEALSAGQVLAQINALPGRMIPNSTSLYSRAKALGMPTIRALAIVPSAEAAAVDEDEREATAMICAGKGAMALAEEFGWTIERAQEFAAGVRAKLKAAVRGGPA